VTAQKWNALERSVPRDALYHIALAQKERYAGLAAASGRS